MGPPFLVELLAHETVRLLRVARRDVRLPPDLPGDPEEHEALRLVELVQALLEVALGHPRLRGAHVLRRHLARELLVREAPRPLEDVDRVPRVPEVGGDVRDQLHDGIVHGPRMEREAHPDLQDVPQLPVGVLRELDRVRPAERAHCGRVEEVERLPPLGDQDQGDVALPRLLAEPRERVHELGPALLEEDVDLVEDDDQVDLLLLDPLPEGVELLGDREPAVREPRVEVLEDVEEHGVVPHLLPAVHMHVVEPAPVLVRVHPEVL